MVKKLYYINMKNKDTAIKTLSFRLMRIINKHLAIEQLPIRFAEQVVFTPREIHTIQAVGEHKQINVKELGDYFGITKSAASQMAAKLADKGFIKKENPADNNKELQLSLTETGWAAFRAHERFHGKHMKNLTERLNSAFSVREITKAAAMLELIEELVDERMSELGLKE